MARPLNIMDIIVIVVLIIFVAAIVIYFLSTLIIVLVIIGVGYFIYKWYKRERLSERRRITADTNQVFLGESMLIGAQQEDITNFVIDMI